MPISRYSAIHIKVWKYIVANMISLSCVLLLARKSG